MSALVRRAGTYVRGLDPRLPRSVWTMEAAVLANAFGNGALALERNILPELRLTPA